MKLLFVSHSAGMLGAERSLVELVAGAVADGHDVHVALPRAGPLERACQAVGASCTLLPIYAWMGRYHHFWPIGVLRLLQMIVALPRHVSSLRSLRPDVVVTNSASVPGAAWAAARCKIPHVWIVRESFGSNRQLRATLPKFVIARSILSWSDVVCTVSAFVEAQLRSIGGCTGRVLPVRPKPSVPARDVVRAPTTKRAGHIRLVLVGHVSGEKGQFLAVRAMHLVRRWGCDGATLDVVGTGPRFSILMLRLLIRLLRLTRQVHLRGWSDDVVQIYREADALLMLSANEAFGRTTAEALLTELPVLGVRSGATPELLHEGGGCLVSHRTASDIAAAVMAWAALPPAEWLHVLEGARAAGRRLSAAPTQYDFLRSALNELKLADVG